MGNLYTIGHSQHKTDYFISLLKKYNINYVLDVRSTPYSKFADQFNKERIRGLLTKEEIHYSFFGKYFGARQEDISLYNDEGYLDFDRVRSSSNFKVGYDNVIVGLEKENNIALMCTEKDPIDCHRTIMVSRAFDLAGIEVNHILCDGTLQNQSEVNQRLMDMYFPDRNQLSIFDYLDNTNEEVSLLEAYKKRNAEIGYHINQEEVVAM